MKLTFEFNGQTVSTHTSRGRSIAIPVNFDGPQPNHFGVARSSVKTVEVGDFVGDTDRGGSCNVDQLTMIPHCNGTHTESVGHIVGQPVPVGALVNDAWQIAALVSVTPVSARDTGESYRPELDHHDMLVTADALKLAAEVRDMSNVSALIIRTLPNRQEKKTVAYGQPDHPPFLTIEAMNWIVESGLGHLLLDLPSVDKMYDEGLLTNHHLFWNVAEGSHRPGENTRFNNTITEMVFVDDDIVDGVYLLNIQIPAFNSDAAPSRPILFPLSD